MWNKRSEESILLFASSILSELLYSHSFISSAFIFFPISLFITVKIISCIIIILIQCEISISLLHLVSSFLLLTLSHNPFIKNSLAQNHLCFLATCSILSSLSICLVRSRNTSGYGQQSSCFY